MAPPDIVAAIAEKKNLTSDIGLLREEGVVEVVLPVENLIRLQFHGARIDHSCPSARHADIHILVKEHAFRGADIAEVHRTVPVHIPVHGITTAIAALAVLALYIDTPHRVGEVFLIADNGDDGYCVVVLGLNIASRDGHAGQITILEQAEHEICGAPGIKHPICTLLAGGVGC